MRATDWAAAFDDAALPLVLLVAACVFTMMAYQAARLHVEVMGFRWRDVASAVLILAAAVMFRATTGEAAPCNYRCPINGICGDDGGYLGTRAVDTFVLIVLLVGGVFVGFKHARDAALGRVQRRDSEARIAALVNGSGIGRAAGSRSR